MGWARMSDDKAAIGATWDPVGGRPVNPDLAASATHDDRPSIAKLQRMEQQMESAPWERTTPHAVSNAEYDLGRFDGPPDAAGTCAIRNATPVLLEIVAAALHWQHWRREWKERSFSNIREELEAASDLLDAALSKVRQ